VVWSASQECQTCSHSSSKAEHFIGVYPGIRIEASHASSACSGRYSSCFAIEAGTARNEDKQQRHGPGARRRTWPGVGQHGQQGLSLSGDSVLRKDKGGFLYERI
jgi:hypothetical protein